MSNIDVNEVELNGVKYVRKDSVSFPAAVPGDIQIVVADRGFVYIGKVEITSEYTILRKAQNIRIWGTSRGLGELVSGPREQTKLDPVGTVRIPNRAVISIIDVEQSKWKLL